MGAPKASLEWHGSTLLRRTCGVLRRAGLDPVVVVRAPGQQLPVLPADVELVDDDREGLGPLQGMAVGLAAVSTRSEVAFVCSTDLPFLHAELVRRVLRPFAAPGGDALDVVRPVGAARPAGWRAWRRCCTCGGPCSSGRRTSATRRGCWGEG